MFSAYAKLSDTRYREIFGLDFEQFEPGQVFHHRPGVTLSQNDNAEEALDTVNAAMLHYDAHYAAATEWKKPLGVSTMTLQRVIGATWKTFARKDRITSFKNIAMTRPVFGGDTLYAETTVLDKADAGNSAGGRVHLETRGLNQNGDKVTKIDYFMEVYRAGRHPFYGALDTGLTEARFSAYDALGDNGFREQTGLYYEDFVPGETFEHWPGLTIGADLAARHALHSLDWNPRYIDRAYNESCFGRRDAPATELYVLGLCTAASTRTLGRVVANLAWTNTRLARHVYPGETLYAETEILSMRESRSRPAQGIVTVNTRARTAEGEDICSFDRALLVYKKGKGPYQAAGY